MSSTYSGTTSTIGGTTFDLLCRPDSVPNYACDAVVDLRREQNLERAEEKLIDLVRNNISSLEIGTGKKVEKFYIGKTYVQKNKRCQHFDPMNHQTWKKKGICDRWGKHRNEFYGKDGLVVLGVVDKEAVPSECRGKIRQESYALALEQGLLHHFMIKDPDNRIANETFSTGQTEKKTSIGHPVYMAYVLAPSGRPEEPLSRKAGVRFREPLHLVDDMQNGGVPSQNHGDNTAGSPKSTSDLGGLSWSTQAESPHATPMAYTQQWAQQLESASNEPVARDAQAQLQTIVDGLPGTPSASCADGTQVKAHHSASGATNSMSPTTVSEKRLVDITSAFAAIPVPILASAYKGTNNCGSNDSSSNNNPSPGAHRGLEPGNHHDRGPEPGHRHGGQLGGNPAPVAFDNCPGSCRNRSTTRPRYNCPNCNQCCHKKCLMEMTVTPEATYMFQCGFEVAKCEAARGRGASWVQCITCKKTFHKNCVKELL